MKYLFIIALIWVGLIACKENNRPSEDSWKFTDVTYFDSLFIKNEIGWTGGDGTYSVLLPDGRNVWIFGDTFLGGLSGNERVKTSPLYIRNSFVVMDGDSLTTLHKGKPEEFKSMMIPPEVIEGQADEYKIWYWPGDGFVREDTLNVFVSKFTQVDTGMWDFKFIETALVSFKLPEIVEVKHETVQDTRDQPIHFGHAVFQENGYTYIYGLGKGGPCVARASKSLSSGWEYWNGEGWINNIKEAKPMISIEGSEQFSVIKLKDQYVYVTQEGDLGNRVYSLLGSSPVGPWSDKVKIFETLIPFDNPNLFTYNALLHPQFMDDKSILLSYNTNSFEMADHFKNAGIYRPRFARISLDSILVK